MVKFQPSSGSGWSLVSTVAASAQVRSRSEEISRSSTSPVREETSLYPLCQVGRMREEKVEVEGPRGGE